MPIYLLVYDVHYKPVIIGSTVADNIDKAETYFSEKGLVSGEVISAEDFKNQCDLNAFENQSPE